MPKAKRQQHNHERRDVWLKQRKWDTQDMALHQQLYQKLQPRQLDDTGTAAIKFAESKPVMAVTAAVA
jgi:hypothetical protein